MKVPASVCQPHPYIGVTRSLICSSRLLLTAPFALIVTYLHLNVRFGPKADIRPKISNSGIWTLTAVCRQLRRIQHPPAQNDLFDSAPGLNGSGRVLTQQQQIGTLAHFHRADLAVQF